MRGYILGQSSVPSLYQGGVMTDLNAIISPGSSLSLQIANDVNDRGEIAGYACGPGHWRRPGLPGDPLPDGSPFQHRRLQATARSGQKLAQTPPPLAQHPSHKRRQPWFRKCQASRVRPTHAAPLWSRSVAVVWRAHRSLYQKASLTQATLNPRPLIFCRRTWRLVSAAMQAPTRAGLWEVAVVGLVQKTEISASAFVGTAVRAATNSFATRSAGHRLNAAVGFA